MKKKHRIFIIVFVAVAATAIALARILAASHGTGAAAAGGGRDRAVPVEVQNISMRSMTEIREFTGTVKASYTYIVSAKVAGRLVSINKRIGDAVKANEMIGRIDDTEYRNALEEAQTQVSVSQATLEEANANLSHIQTELKRSRELLEKGIVSKAEFDALNNQYETQKSRCELANAMLKQRQILLSQAQTNFEYTSIRAAQNGFIAQRHVDGGTLLSVGTAVVTVVGIDTVFVELAVSEKDYRSIKQGKKAVITTDAVSSKSFEGVVYRVAPFFQSATRTAAVEIALQNDEHLLMPGMFSRIKIVLEEDERAKVLPLSALVDNKGKDAVFVVDDSSKVRLVPVETGINDGKYVQILSDIDINVQVVTLGQHLLRDGASVSVGI
jgi:RND family efflux transporter MFP subunit